MLARVSTLWVPGAAGPLEQFVERIHRQISAYAEQNGVETVSVEVELHDGAVLNVKEISAEPGFGFVSLAPYTAEGGEPVELLIVPVGTVTRITLGKEPAKRERFGFT